MNRKNYNKNRNKSDNKNELKKITLDYEKEPQLFGDVAKELAKKLEEEAKKSRSKNINNANQIRNFYDKVIELNKKAQNCESEEEYKKNIYPFVVMLNSKVAYAKTRNLVSDTFVEMINQCVKEADSIKKMNNFKLFFEAVIGFYPKK